jgi:transcription-repair coupling factor (superfamily II helicase)
VFLSSLSDVVLGEPVIADALADAPHLGTLDLTAPAGLRPFLVDGLVRAGRTVLLVTATGREAEELTAEIGALVDPATVAHYPSWETLPHERLSPRSDTVGRRLAVLRRLRHPGVDGSTGPLRVVVAPVRSILQPQVQGLGDLEPVELVVGQTADLDDVTRRLADAAYTRVDLVEKRGEFAVRGGLVDVFPPTEQHPVRVEFWGDEVEEIRSFAVADQRTIDKAERTLTGTRRRVKLSPSGVRSLAY